MIPFIENKVVYFSHGVFQKDACQFLLFTFFKQNEHNGLLEKSENANKLYRVMAQQGPS